MPERIDLHLVNRRKLYEVVCMFAQGWEPSIISRHWRVENIHGVGYVEMDDAHRAILLSAFDEDPVPVNWI